MHIKILNTRRLVIAQVRRDSALVTCLRDAAAAGFVHALESLSAARTHLQIPARRAELAFSTMKIDSHRYLQLRHVRISQQLALTLNALENICSSLIQSKPDDFHSLSYFIIVWHFTPHSNTVPNTKS